MKNASLRLSLAVAVSLSGLFGQQTLNRQNVADILGFENGSPGAFPAGWSLTGGDRSEISIDDKVFHGGKYSARIDRNSSSGGAFTAIGFSIPIDFSGRTIELRGFLKTANVSDSIAIAIREDGTTPSLAFATTQGQQVRGTTDWKEYSVTLPVNANAKTLVVFFLLAGTGQSWADDLRLLVDNQPIANAPQPLTRKNVADSLGFENGTAGAFPVVWTLASGARTEISIDDRVFHGGKYSARIDRTPSSGGAFSGIGLAIPIDFGGRTIELRGFLKTANVSDSIAIAIREDGTTPNLAFATTQGQQVRGTTDWKEYSVTLPVHTEGKTLFVFFLLAGTGQAWADDLRLLLDGQPIANAPDRAPTILETDKEFDGNSRVTITTLSDGQVRNLATLARVWGFLKYHHPAVTSGKRHWDYDLFRILPAVLASSDSASANRAISGWIGGLGAVATCTTCASLKTSDLYLSPDLDWIADESLLGPDLSQSLRAIYRNRTAANTQFFVSLAPNILNPVFENELTYPGLRFPDAGYQLLGLFRYWNMVQYFYPDRDVMADDPAAAPAYWNHVLEEFIPAIALADSSLTYQQELIRFIAKINDTHANLWSSIAARPPVGSCQLPVDIRFVEGKALVIRHRSPTAGPASGLMPGDILEQLDGVAVADLVAQWRPMYADSNEAARLRDIGQYLTRGACGETGVTVIRGEETLTLSPNRVATNTLGPAASTHDLPGETFQKLSDDVAYLKLSSVQAGKSASYIESAAGTKGMIIDIRNYPSEFVVFTLGSLLVSAPSEFVRFTNGDVTNPGAIHWGPTIVLTPQQPHYSGKIVILVDEVTQSQAEYTTMAFRTAPGAIVIGSTTAGADGNVSTVLLPGGFSSLFSGLGVFYPDNRPTQRVGILPDLVVKPTIAGIRAGKDELVEEAIRQITGLP